LQQTPSAQKFDMHCEGPEHGSPSARLPPQAWPSQQTPSSHWFVEQSLSQTQLCPGWRRASSMKTKQFSLPPPSTRSVLVRARDLVLIVFVPQAANRKAAIPTSTTTHREWVELCIARLL
jgi:hypothetical protein